MLASVENVGAAPLAKAMTRNPMTITPDGSAIDALRAMDNGGFRHLPVIEKERILGVVSRTNFTGIEIDRLDEEEHLIPPSAIADSCCRRAILGSSGS